MFIFANGNKTKLIYNGISSKKDSILCCPAGNEHKPKRSTEATDSRETATKHTGACSCAATL
jgi:hypothetical protein